MIAFGTFPLTASQMPTLVPCPVPLHKVSSVSSIRFSFKLLPCCGDRDPHPPLHCALTRMNYVRELSLRAAPAYLRLLCACTLDGRELFCIWAWAQALQEQKISLQSNAYFFQLLKGRTQLQPLRVKKAFLASCFSVCVDGFGATLVIFPSSFLWRIKIHLPL